MRSRCHIQSPSSFAWKVPAVRLSFVIRTLTKSSPDSPDHAACECMQPAGQFELSGQSTIFRPKFLHSLSVRTFWRHRHLLYPSLLRPRVLDDLNRPIPVIPWDKPILASFWPRVTRTTNYSVGSSLVFHFSTRAPAGN